MPGLGRAKGQYREIFNSDSQHYGGSNIGNLSVVDEQAVPSSGFLASVQLNLPPLGVVILTAAS